jgi:hypothetical protein
MGVQVLTTREAGGFPLATQDGGVVPAQAVPLDTLLLGEQGTSYTLGEATTMAVSGDNFIPGTAGALLFVCQALSLGDGVFDFNCNININSDTAGDQVSLGLFALELVSVTGGSALPGVNPPGTITKLPSATSPAANTGLLLNAMGTVCITEGGSHNASLSCARVRFQGTPGSLLAVACIASSVNNSGSKWAVAGSMVLQELVP